MPRMLKQLAAVTLLGLAAGANNNTQALTPQAALDLALQQQASALQRGKDAVAALKQLAAVNVTEHVEAAIEEALKSAHAGEDKAHALEDEIAKDLEALNASVAAEADAVEEKEARAAAAAANQRADATKAAAQKAAKAAQAAQTKAEAMAKAYAAVNATAEGKLRKAVQYSKDEVSKLMAEEAHAALGDAAKLAKELAAQQRQQQKQAAQAAATAKKAQDVAAATKADEDAARTMAEELLKRAGVSTTEGPAKGEGQPAIMLLASEGGEDKSEKEDEKEVASDAYDADAVQHEAELQALEDAPQRFAKAVRNAVEEWVHLKDEGFRAASKTVQGLHEQGEAAIRKNMKEVEEAAAAAREAEYHAARARRALGQPQPKGQEEVKELIYEAEAEARKAERVEAEIYGEAKRELEKLERASWAKDAKEANQWKSKAAFLERHGEEAVEEVVAIDRAEKHDEEKREEREEEEKYEEEEHPNEGRKSGRKGHRGTKSLAAVPSARASTSSEGLLACVAAAVGLAIFTVVARPLGRRSIRQQPPLLG